MKRNKDDLDRKFNLVWNLAITGIVLSGIFWVIAFGFAGWLAMRLMNFFGVTQ